MQKLDHSHITTVREFLRSSPGYLKKSAYVIAYRLKLENNEEVIKMIKGQVKERKRLNKLNSEYIKKEENRKNNLTAIEKVEEKIFYRSTGTGGRGIKFAELEELIQEQPSDIVFNEENLNIKEPKHNVLVIGDIHEPFTLEGYLEFCKEQYDRFNCDTVVFIGDIIDNAFSSFHPTNPDGYGAGDELDRAIDKIALWYNAFPEATVIIGNHDRLAYRKAFAGGISSRWIREYKDVLNTPGWTFMESITIDNVFYCHGEAGTARTKAKDTSRSTVQGHLHSQAYVEYINNRIFAAQVGTGIDDSSYAFNYNKAGKESILSCLVIEQGIQPFLIKK